MTQQGSMLMWSKLANESDDTDSPGMAAFKIREPREVGPLQGCCVADCGTRRNGTLHIFRVFAVPPMVSLTFAAESKEEAESWKETLNEAFQFPTPVENYRPIWESIKDFYYARGPPPGLEPPSSTMDIEIVKASGLAGALINQSQRCNPYVVCR